ncbi:MAG: hypothetical protein RLZZ177_2202 [Pseudomonadota bacterium]|jgi:hypothetical protein
MPRRQLVLIGGSAGWMLPTEWLTQFEEVHAWDIDPMAAPLFRWRHGQALKREGTRLNLHTGDGLAQLDEWTRILPTAFFWFDNVLGQLRFTDPSPDAVEQRLKNFQRQLETVAWGSVHDRMSGRHTPGTLFPMARHSEAGLAMETTEGQAWLLQMGAISPWLDHLTEGVLPKGTPVQHTAWPFKPRYAHWLEMGWTGPS